MKGKRKGRKRKRKEGKRKKEKKGNGKEREKEEGGQRFLPEFTDVPRVRIRLTKE